MDNALPLLIRWLHFLLGITWIGLLSYLARLANLLLAAATTNAVVARERREWPPPCEPPSPSR